MTGKDEINQRGLSELLRIDRQSVHRLSKSGVFVGRREGRRTLYNVRENVRRYLDYRRDLLARRDPALLKARLRRAVAEATHAELRAATLRREVVESYAAESYWNALRCWFTQIGRKHASLVAKECLGLVELGDIHEQIKAGVEAWLLTFKTFPQSRAYEELQGELSRAGKHA